MQIFVDGNPGGSALGPPGNVTCNLNRPLTWPNDPFVVFGAEKHEAGSKYPSFSGWLDEKRVSSIIRYSGSFSPPKAPFSPDSQTRVLYHLDVGSNTTVLDSSGADAGLSHGERCLSGPFNGPVYDSVVKRF